MSSLTQLIDFEGEYQPTIEEWLDKEGFKSKGFNFSVITVLGCQSSGKSTLLNELFETTFEVMDAARGRRQTTKGLWLGRDKANSLLIIDVEGTDSKERGEDRLTFEHRAALFSLALADVVIVNMWYHDLGRYTASNYGLLKTVLGVNLELFQQQEDAPKTIMVFVIRDYSEAQTPLDTLEEMIHTDIREIWKETRKPEHLKDSSPDDYFVFKTIGLPSKFSQPEKFSSQCQALHTQLTMECLPSTYSRQVPADGFGFYSRNVWETILKSSELDIPSQKEMVATYRCEELKNSALAEVLPQLPTYLSQAAAGELPMKEFSWAVNIVEKALSLYDGPAGRYQRPVYRKKREQLLASLQMELQKVINAHLTHIRHRVASDASSALELLFAVNHGHAELIGTVPMLQCWEKFSETTDRWRDEFINQFGSLVSSLSLTYIDCEDGSTQVMDFDVSLARQALIESLEALLLRMRERQKAEFVKVVGEAASTALGDLDVFLEAVETTRESFWKSLSDTVKLAKEKVVESLGEAWFGLQTGTDAHSERWHLEATRRTVVELKLKLIRICEWLNHHIFTRFQLFFDQDEQGVPRQWQEMSSDQIKEVYLKARDKALILLTFFDGPFELDLKHLQCVDDDLIVAELQKIALPDAKKQQILTKASRQMQKACQEAQLIQTTGGRGVNVPWWMWLLLLLFGWNEISMIIFSPVSLMVLITAVCIGTVSYYTGNIKLPVQFARHLVGVCASSAMPILNAMQNQPPPSARTIKTEIKTE